MLICSYEAGQMVKNNKKNPNLYVEAVDCKWAGFKSIQKACPGCNAKLGAGT